MCLQYTSLANLPFEIEYVLMPPSKKTCNGSLQIDYTICLADDTDTFQSIFWSISKLNFLFGSVLVSKDIALEDHIKIEVAIRIDLSRVLLRYNYNRNAH